ncbi:hypothetical protein G0U57_017653 [Chelydra serpentina]|uniref:Uncharacterized protein n=1 Tax=Chelydra serpentina TaxID=8475 RepID=A0A8T1SZX0_CHESE|nr:hypothetical protein G0U57_017653 [Chelydra serpentina]
MGALSRVVRATAALLLCWALAGLLLPPPARAAADISPKCYLYVWFAWMSKEL